MRMCVTLMILVCIATPAHAQDREALHAQAVKESLTPIRPGLPGKAPFWNENTKQFIYAPAFDFKAVADAVSYRFTITCSDGGTLIFSARDPWAPFSSVWDNIPVGQTKLLCEGLNQTGKVCGEAGSRTFHRAAAFNGPYGKPVLPYAESARVALKSVIAEPFVQAWRQSTEPDPSYPLYRYPSKLLGSLMTACAMDGADSPDAKVSFEIGTRAADFLRRISGQPGTPLEGFPPSYYKAKPTERENDNWTMMFSGAEAGHGYLDLYDVSHRREYLDAAKAIARAYERLQLDSGTWYLKVDNQTGKPISDLVLIPSAVIRFLDRLITQHHLEEFQPVLDRAVRWIMDNPARTFDWQAQFDDAKLRGPYQNLSKHEACEFAAYLFDHHKSDPQKLELAKDLLRFAEDQFVIWEQPPDLKVRFDNLKPENWFTPCSAEQYAMWEPISGSSAFMIITYAKAYRATGDKLHLAKAQSLASALTVAQQHHHGRYPTRMVREDLLYWANSTVNTVRAMKLLAEEEKNQKIAP